MGGVFRQPVLVSRDLPELIRSMREKGIDTLAAALDRSAMTSDEARARPGRRGGGHRQ